MGDRQLVGEMMNRALYEATFIQLYEDGVSELLAFQTAYIVATDHLRRDGRTPEQMAIVRLAWEQYWGISQGDRG
jgi:hypothetical protein